MNGVWVRLRISTLFVALLFSFATTRCSASRISGTYVAHGAHFAEMLQLTQTDNGQINGVLSSLQIQPDGAVNSEQRPVTGSVDSDQLTLNIGSFLLRTALAGTISGNTIHLQIADSKGHIATSVFVRSTADEFKRYANELNSQGEGIVLSRKLLKGAQEFRETIQTAEKWISNAELHAQRIRRVEDTYEKIELRMQSLVDRERVTLDAVTRSQISVAVGQGEIAGDQTDIQVEQIWDFTIKDQGASLQKVFSLWDGNCQRSEEFKREGATSESLESWLSACNLTLMERAKFDPIFKRIMDQRAQLKLFQATAQNKRKALVDEATRIE